MIPAAETVVVWIQSVKREQAWGVGKGRVVQGGTGVGWVEEGEGEQPLLFEGSQSMGALPLRTSSTYLITRVRGPFEGPLRQIRHRLSAS